MKRVKRFAAVILLIGILSGIMALPAAAVTTHEYIFALPAVQAGSVRSTLLYERGTGNAYVKPEIATISTVYYLSPTRLSSTQATDVIFLTGISKSYFKWKSGYGGKETQLCLSACPDWKLPPHNPYAARGDWAM